MGLEDVLARGVEELESLLSPAAPPAPPVGEADARGAWRLCVGEGWRLRLAVSCREPPPGGPAVPGPLAGVPVAYKDNMEFPGEEVRLGSRVVFARGPGVAAPVAALAGHGAVPVARASMDEFGLGVAGYNTFLGTAVNPAAPGRVVGGSTSGGAGLVALWRAGVALATDAGGSARIPAAFTGLYGFKLRRRDASLEGVYTVSPSMEAAGVIAADHATLAWALEALSPGLLRRALALLALWRRGAQPRPRLLVPAWYRGEAEQAVAEAFESSLEGLEEAGYTVAEAGLEALRALDRARAAVTLAEAAGRILSRAPPEALPDPLRGLLADAARLPAPLYRRALEALAAAREAAGAALGGSAVIATPATPLDVPPLEEAGRAAYSRRMIAFTGLANALDWASATLPGTARLPSGLPVGVMLTAPDPATLLAVILDVRGGGRPGSHL